MFERRQCIIVPRQYNAFQLDIYLKYICHQFYEYGFTSYCCKLWLYKHVLSKANDTLQSTKLLKKFRLLILVDCGDCSFGTCFLQYPLLQGFEFFLFFHFFLHFCFFRFFLLSFFLTEQCRHEVIVEVDHQEEGKLFPHYSVENYTFDILL